MRPQHLIFFAYFAAILACLSTNAASQRHTSFLQQSAEKMMKEARVPGLSIAVLKGGKTEQLLALGVTDNEKGSPVTQTTVFEAASLSKPVLAYITLKLVADGQINLGTRLSSQIEHERIHNPEYAKLITPMLVLSHQTGLPNWGGNALSFDFKPGTGFQYSGEGYVYLQRVLEKITGKDLQTLAKTLVFDPLGMKNSYFTWPEEQTLPLASGHDRTGTPVSRRIPDANGASSLHTTAEDYAKFMQAWLDVAGMPTPDKKLPFTWLVELKGDEQGAAEPLPDEDILGWALGWGIHSKQQEENIAWHWGDNGVFRAFVAMNLKTKDGIVFFANSQNGLAIAKRLVEPVVGAMDNTFHWLQYGQSDTPGWQAMQSGYEAEDAGDYPTAIKHFNQVLKLFPQNDRLRNRVTWLQDTIKYSGAAVALSNEDMTSIVGNYGPRSIRLVDGNLYYQRQGNTSHKLRPLTQSLFAVGSLSDFRIEVVKDEGGKGKMLIGHYAEGGQDESPRTE